MGTRFSKASRWLLFAGLATAQAAPAFGAPPQSQSAPQPSHSAPSSPDPPLTPGDMDKLPISLDRIREQLAREPGLSLNLLHALDNVPVFRTETRSDLVFRPDPNYWKDNDVGAFVRPTVNKWNYDYMKMQNPSSMAGYGMNVLPAVTSLVSGIRRAFQERSEAQVRRQIQEELRQINEQRRADGLPPLEDASTAPRGRQLTEPNPPSQPNEPKQP